MHRSFRGTLTCGIAICALALHTADAAAAPPLPNPDGKFDYQITDAYDPGEGFTVVSRNPEIDVDKPSELHGSSLRGDGNLYRICYLNALQTQEEDYAWWESKHPDLILRDDNGDPIHDPDEEWQGEALLDVSTPEKRAALLSVQRAWIENCKRQNYQAIEPDNIDSYERAQGKLRPDDVEAYMIEFVKVAHQYDLAVAQKNAVEWIYEGRASTVGFDFAIVEECHLTNECDDPIEHYGAANVFEIEYWYDTDDSSSGVTIPAHSDAHFQEACCERGETIRIVIRNRDVRSSTEAGYYRDVCEPNSEASPEC